MKEQTVGGGNPFGSSHDWWACKKRKRPGIQIYKQDDAAFADYLFNVGFSKRF